MSRTTVAPGDSVTITSRGFSACPRRYASSTRYTVTMDGSNESTVVAVAPDGSFKDVVWIPRSLKPGVTEIWLHGSPWDDCNDTPNMASCAGYHSPSITVVRR